MKDTIFGIFNYKSKIDIELIIYYDDIFNVGYTRTIKFLAFSDVPVVDFAKFKLSMFLQNSEETEGRISDY